MLGKYSKLYKNNKSKTSNRNYDRFVNELQKLRRIHIKSPSKNAKRTKNNLNEKYSKI